MKLLMNGLLGLTIFILAACSSIDSDEDSKRVAPKAEKMVPKKAGFQSVPTSGIHAVNTAPIKKTDLAKQKMIKDAEQIQLQKENKYKLPDGLYAELNTTKGIIIIKLFYQKTPLTVANFVGLAEGTKYSKREGRPFYDNTVFHHVARNFAVRAGCPKGTGKGGPGYSFPDEFDSRLELDAAGMVAMSNNGPDSNGSQFFFTLKPMAWLNGRNTVFGKVVRGVDILKSIRKGDKIKKMTILRIGKNLKQYRASQDLFNKLLAEKLKKDGKTLKIGPKNPRSIYQKW